jgi:phage terminase large subunit-like protein
VARRSSGPSDPTAHKPLAPFTVDHFRRYSALMVLDTGNFWPIEDFQLEVVGDFFGGAVEVWTIVPEGNAKTTLMSGLSLYWADYTPSASVLMAAASRDQAGLLFSQAQGFVDRSPGFDRRFRVFEGYRRIKAIRTAGRIQVFAADDRTGDGVLFDLALLDELHRHRDLKLARTWIGKANKRSGKVGVISTAGEPGTEFEDARARMIATATDLTRVGSHTRAASEDAVLHDWSVPSGGDVEDLEVVKAANPLSTVTVEALRKKRGSPSMTTNHWLRFVCNQAVRTEETAIDTFEWADAIGGEVPEGVPVLVGADFGWKHDTTALVPLWMEGAESRLFGRPEILIPPRNGQNLSPQKIKDAFLRINERNPIQTVVMDPDRAAEVADWLENELGVDVVEHLQTAGPMCQAYERFTEGLRNGWLKHPGDPEFSEHVLNAMARLLPDGKARFDRPSTSRAQAGQRRRVIDALIAAAIVHNVAVEEFAKPAVSREVVFL